MAEPKTIDNLGVQASIDYAGGLEQRDTSLIRDARGVAALTGTSSLSPAYSEITSLVGLDQINRPYALFQRPSGYEEGAGRIFKHGLSPAFGAPEKTEAVEARIQAVEATGKAAREKKVISDVLQTKRTFDQDIQRVESKRGEFHKG